MVLQRPGKGYRGHGPGTVILIFVFVWMRTVGIPWLHGASKMSNGRIADGFYYLLPIRPGGKRFGEHCCRCVPSGVQGTPLVEEHGIQGIL